MQYTSEIDKIFETYTFNICVKTYATSRYNTYNLQHENTCCNGRLEQMKHLEYTVVATYV
jgi:hypothetical protein